jgi:thiol-disulfide isomerase/thioredoxin
MIKIISTVLLALLLTACGSEDKSEAKKFNTEKHSDNTTPTTLEELQAKVSSPVKTKETAHVASSSGPTKEAASAIPETFKKDIFALTTLEGKTLHVDEVDGGIVFKEHKGKVVFLLFFGFKCPPCLAEIPVLKAMAGKKHDDMEIIAVEVQRMPSNDLKKFKADKGINYTLLSGDEGQNSKFISYIGGRAQWGGSIPFLVALNPKGEVKVVHVGGMGEKEFKTIYDKLSKEK